MPAAGDTRVAVRLSMNRFGKGIGVLIVAGLIYILSGIILSPSLGMAGRLLMLLGFFVVVVPVVVILLAPWNFEHVDEDQELLRFLQETLSANESHNLPSTRG